MAKKFGKVLMLAAAAAAVGGAAYYYMKKKDAELLANPDEDYDDFSDDFDDEPLRSYVPLSQDSPDENASEKAAEEVSPANAEDLEADNCGVTTAQEEVSAKEAVAEEVPAKETVTEEVPAKETVSEEIPFEETAAAQPAEAIPVEDFLDEDEEAAEDTFTPLAENVVEVTADIPTEVEEGVEEFFDEDDEETFEN